MSMPPLVPLGLRIGVEVRGSQVAFVDDDPMPCGSGDVPEVEGQLSYGDFDHGVPFGGRVGG